MLSRYSMTEWIYFNPCPVISELANQLAMIQPGDGWRFVEKPGAPWEMKAHESSAEHLQFHLFLDLLWQKQMLCYAKSLQLCPTLCDPIDSSPPGSPIPGLLQARTLEWVAISFSNAWKWKSLSRVRLLATPWTTAYQAPPSMGFSRQEYWSGVPFKLIIKSSSHSFSTWYSLHYTYCFMH